MMINDNIFQDDLGMMQCHPLLAQHVTQKLTVYLLGNPEHIYLFNQRQFTLLFCLE